MINGSPFARPVAPQLGLGSKYDHVEPGKSDEVVYDLDILQLRPCRAVVLRANESARDLNVVPPNNDGMFQEGQTADVANAIRVRSNDIVDAETILLRSRALVHARNTAQRLGRRQIARRGR